MVFTDDYHAVAASRGTNLDWLWHVNAPPWSPPSETLPHGTLNRHFILLAPTGAQMQDPGPLKVG
jgi:hypothetical protein